MEQGTKTTPAVEVWRPVVGWEGLYEVSSHGQVRSLDRVVEKLEWNGKKYQILYRGKILAQSLKSIGYCEVTLYLDGKYKTFKVHRLVAEAFIPNPDNLPCVNHKDECKSNNHADNLEWCSHYYNNHYKDRMERAAKSKSRPIEQLSLTGEHIAFFPSSAIAIRTLNMKSNHLCSVLTGNRKSTYGYRWRYVDN